MASMAFFARMSSSSVGRPIRPRPRCSAFAEASSPEYVQTTLSTSDGLALVKAFAQIKNAKLRRRLVDLVEEMAGEETA